MASNIATMAGGFALAQANRRRYPKSLGYGLGSEGVP
jgi:hypothetical protein